MMHLKARTSLTNGTCKPSPSLLQLVFQGHLDRTVTRSASARRRTSSATRCLDHVTALQVLMAPNVTKVCKIAYLYLLDISHYTEEGSKSFLKVLILCFVHSLWRRSLWSGLWTRVPVWKWREVRSFHRSLWMSSRIYRSTLQHQWVHLTLRWWRWIIIHVISVGWQVSGVCLRGDSVSCWTLRSWLRSGGAVWRRSPEWPGHRSLWVHPWTQRRGLWTRWVFSTVDAFVWDLFVYLEASSQ